MSQAAVVRRPAQKRWIVAGAVLTVIGLIGGLLAGWALFSDSESRGPQSVSSGSVSITLSDPGSAKIEDSISNMMAGDYRDRSVTVTNSSSPAGNVGSLKLSASAATANNLVDDEDNGLQVQVWSCDEEYEQAGAGPYTFTCEGTETQVVGTGGNSVPFGDLEDGVTLADPFTASAGWYRINLSIDSDATNASSGLANQLTWTFTAVQRTGQRI